MPQPITYKGGTYYFDAPKRDSVSLPVNCEQCGKPIPVDSACWRSGERYLHISCGDKYRTV